MSPRLGSLCATAVVAVLASAPSPAAAQAFTLPQGIGAVTLAWQYVDNTGHRLSDGYLRVAGQSVTTSLDFELDVRKQPDPKGDRVVITMNGKFLPYRKW